jgi:hypothetical protein
VTVEVNDFAGNPTQANLRVCVCNPPTTPCPGDLTIRDAADDRGAIPYLGPDASMSPDIAVNPAVPARKDLLLIDSDNTIEVTFWNFGCSDIPFGKSVDVSLGWGGVTSTSPATLIATKPVPAPAGGWPMASWGTVSFKWHVPLTMNPGPGVLKAWLDLGTDDRHLDVAMAPTVKLDDNQAQRSITFVAPAIAGPGALPPATPPSAPPPPADPGDMAFYLIPMEGVTERVLEVSLVRPEERSRFFRINLHAGPGFSGGAIQGGRVLGDYRGQRPANLESLPLQEPLSWRRASTLGFTRTIGITDAAPLRIDGVHLDRRVKLWIEAIPARGVKPGLVTEFRVVELGIPASYGEELELSVITLQFQH